MSTAFHHGFRDARASLGAQPLSSLGLGVVVVVLLGIVQGQTIQSADGVRRVEQLLLGGVTFGILLPLASFALSGSAEVGSEALGRATWARYGANRRAYALGRIACGAAMIAAGAFGVGALALGLSLASGAAGGGPSEGPGLGAVALAAALGAARAARRRAGARDEPRAKRGDAAPTDARLRPRVRQPHATVTRRQRRATREGRASAMSADAAHGGRARGP
jgi:hypothetical protein